jgi:DNA-binding SARP family transcriptional activator
VPDTVLAGRRVLVPIGVRGSQVRTLDLAAQQGLGLTGRGAEPAARALLAMLLNPHQHPDPDPDSDSDSGAGAAAIWLTASSARALLGAQPPDTLPASLRIVADLQQALAEIEVLTFSRARLLAEQPDTPAAPLVLFTDPVPELVARLRHLLRAGAPLGVAAVLLGHWPSGTMCELAIDATITHASATADTAADAHDLLTTRMWTLTHTELTEHLATAATNPPPYASHDEYQHDNEPDHHQGDDEQGDNDERADNDRADNDDERAGDEYEPEYSPVAEDGYEDREGFDDDLEGDSGDGAHDRSRLAGYEDHADHTGGGRDAAGATMTQDIRQPRREPGGAQHPDRHRDGRGVGSGARREPSEPAAAREDSQPASVANADRADRAGGSPVLESVAASRRERGEAEGEVPAEALLVVRCFGQPSVLARGEPGAALRVITEHLSPKHLLLLAALASRPDGVAVEELLEVGWPDSPLGNAKRNLHTTLTHLRRVCKQAVAPGEVSFAVLTANRYHLVPPGRQGGLVWVDYWAFAAALRAARGATGQARWAALRRAAGLYRGPLWDDGSDVAWLETARHRARVDAVTALGQLAEHTYSSCPDQAAALLDTALEHDPTDQASAAALIRLHHHQHRPAVAHRVYTRLVAQLADAGLPGPDPATTAALHHNPTQPAA